jgi:hypothetical protein
MGVDGSLDMEGNEVSAGIGKGSDKGFGLDRHEVDVEGQCGTAAEVGDHLGAKAQIWDKSPVHDVEMGPVSARAGNGFDSSAHG